MSRAQPSLAPAWAGLAEAAMKRARGAIASSATRPGASRLIKLEVRRGRGDLQLLWLMQPEDSELATFLREVRQRLIVASAEACEVCGGHVPRRGPREDVFCDRHDVPF